MTRAGKVYFMDDYAGRVWQDEEGYWFQYDNSYIQMKKPAISLTLPVREAPFVSATMIPFFDGLIPEGWLLEASVRNWKLDSRDRMGLLLVACKDCIGAVSIIEESTSKND